MKFKLLRTKLLVVSTIIFFLFTPIAGAQLEMPFGGIVSTPIPCTCPVVPGLFMVWFTPLYLGGPIVVSGPITFSPYSTLLYAYFMIGVPGTWHLGSYIPGVQACWMIVPPPGVGCFPFPNLGLMTKVGTNRLF